MQPHIIGIAGPSCAGKGELASWLSAELEAPVLDLDAYYLDQRHLTFEERCRQNYDVPESIDSLLLIEQVRELADGCSIQKPVYSFLIHTREPQRVMFEPAPFIILEGLFTLYWPDLLSLLDTKVFIDAGDSESRRRRISRDVVERGRVETDVIRQFDTQVLPAADRYVRPTMQYADLVLNGQNTWESNGRKVLALLPARPHR